MAGYDGGQVCVVRILGPRRIGVTADEAINRSVRRFHVGFLEPPHVLPFP